MARSVLSPLRALPWSEGMARSGNVSFYVLQQKRCDPNKLRSRAIRAVAFFFADSLRERSRGIDINRRELTLRAWTIGRAVWFAVHDRQGLLNLPVNRSLQFGYSTSTTETRGRKELGYRAMHRASTKHGRPCKWDTSIASECQAVV